MIKDFLFKIASELDCQIEEISIEQSTLMRETLFEKFKVSKSGFFLWDSYIPDSYFSNKDDSWLGLDEFIQHHETLLFFDQKVEISFFKLLEGQSIVSLLRSYQHDEYYLTNSSLDYLICCTDTGHLIAAGSARDWLEKRDMAVSVG
ncbi:MAG: hypothetical protein IPO06_01220 [Leptospiraceae bacterium]|jgi:hypothetical protein|nr:hypothetical protein [Leptospiraceae bacterium]